MVVMLKQKKKMSKIRKIFTNEDSSYNIFITKNEEVLPWKKFNSNMAVSVEYDLKY